jgi:hypothetical protein
MVAPNAGKASGRNLLHVTYFAPTVLRSNIDFWKTSVPLHVMKVSGSQTFQRIIISSASGSSNARLLLLLGPEDECTTVSRNASNYLPADTGSHLRLCKNLISNVF